MLNIREFSEKLSQLSRYALAIVFFLIALILRFWIAPAESGYPFVTFYPAMVVAFYFCGIRPGMLVAVLCAATADYLFIPPFWTFYSTYEGYFAVATFLFSGLLIGSIVHQLQKYAEQSYQLFDNSFTGMLAINPKNGRIVKVNRIALTLWGYDADEFFTKSLADLTCPDDLAETNKSVAKLANGVIDNLRLEKRYIKKDGSLFWGETCISTVKDANGKPSLFIVNTIDISDRKKVGLEREQYFNFFNASTDLMCIADPNGCFKKINPACSQTLGYADSELLSKPFIEFVHPDDRQETLDEMARQIQRGYSLKFENRYLCKDGSFRLLSWTAYYNKDEGITYATARDVTEQNRTQQLLLKQKQFSDDVINSLPGIFFLLNQQGEIAKIAPNFLEISGYTRDEVNSMSALSFFDGNDKEVIAQKLQEGFERGNAEVEAELVTKFGQKIPYFFSGHRTTIGDQLYLVGLGIDIKERKLAEHALKESELRFRTVANYTYDWEYWQSPEHTILYMSPSCERITGYAREEFIADPMLLENIIYPDDLPLMHDHLRQSNLLRDSEESEFRILRRDGTICWISHACQAVYNDASQFNGRRVSNRDITARKQADQEKRASEEQLRAFYDLDIVGLAITSPEKGWVRINDCLCKMLEYSEQELRGMTWAQLTHPDDLAADIEQFNRVLANEINGYTLEKRFISSKGKIIYTRMVVRCVRKDGGEVNYVTAMVEDISDRKAAENILRESETRLRLSQEVGGVGTWEADLVNNSQSWSDNCIGILGFPPVSNPTWDDFLAVVHPDDRQRVIDATQSHLERGTKYDVEYRAIDFNGNIRWMRSAGQAERDANGKPVVMRGIVQEVTERHESLHRIEQLLDQQTTILENRLVAMATVRDRKIVWANLAYETLFGFGRGELVGVSPRELYLNEEDYKAVGTAYSNIINDEVIRIEHEFVRKDGSHIWVDMSGMALNKETGEVLWVFVDVTDRKRVEENLLITAGVFASSQEGILITDANNNIIEVNDAFTRISGYSHEDVLGMNPKVLSSGQQKKIFYSKMWQALKRDKAWRGEVWNKRKTGEIYVEMLSISVICDEEGKVLRYVGVFSDISHIKEHEAELRRVAHYDALTGIPNRVLLADRMKQAIAQTSRERNMMAVCYLDLDGFKPINDSLGHDAGDHVLIEVARRIENTIRGGDTVARLGGDEFVILLLGQDKGEECVTTLERLLAAIAQPISFNNNSSMISASIGVSIYPLDDEDPDTLLRHADQAMYMAKQSGKNRFYIYDATLDRQTRDQREFQNSIRHGLAYNQFELYYQPKVNLRTKEMVGAEALIRWRHPDRGLLSPVEFLRATENTDLDIEIGEWVTATALAQMNRWQNSGLNIEISINISGYHLESPRFMDHLQKQLAQYPDMPFGKFQIEVLETVALNDITVVRDIIDACRKFGVGFALDDFGTGYSSLSYLSRLPVDVLKIDQSFVRDMLEEKGDMAIVQGIIALARAFDRQTVAEGIETEAHYQVLLDMGCELGQGYYIARPMTAEELTSWQSR